MEDTKPPEGGWKYTATVAPLAGEPVDVTEQLAGLFDLVVGSLDWGSGFVTEQDKREIIHIGVLCGFDLPECGGSYRMGDQQGYWNWNSVWGVCDLRLYHEGLHGGAGKLGGPLAVDVREAGYRIRWDAAGTLVA